MWVTFSAFRQNAENTTIPGLKRTFSGVISSKMTHSNTCDIASSNYAPFLWQFELPAKLTVAETLLEQSDYWDFKTDPASVFISGPLHLYSPGLAPRA